MELNAIISEMRQKGFANGGQLVLSRDESEELARLARSICENLPTDHPDFLKSERGLLGVRSIPHHHPRIAELINKVVANPEIKKILEANLGKGYKVWQINYRQSVQGDKGLALHQDGKGQLNLVISLSDNSDVHGATSLVPGSHLVPERVSELKLDAPAAIFKTFPMIKTLRAKTGDIAFFFNRTWHGRFPNPSAKVNGAIMLGLFPVGASMSFNPPYLKWSETFLKSIEGTELHQLMSDDRLELQSNGLHKILPKLGSDKTVPFAFEIENLKEKPLYPVSLKLKAFILVLKTILTTGRPVKHFLQNVLGRAAT